MNISDKLVKISEEVSVKMYDNGFVFEVSGRNSDDEWSDVKIICATLAEVTELLTEATKMERS
jgi:hypothetical protein